MMLKRILIIFLFLLLTNQVQNSVNPSNLIIIKSESVNPIEDLIYAVGMVEGKCDTLAYNESEQAYGYFQIRPIRLLDYNQRTGQQYQLKDMYNFLIAKKIFLFYARKIGDYDLEKIARSWNGSGPKTKIYWDRVSAYL
jgi:hypothetical protein